MKTFQNYFLRKLLSYIWPITKKVESEKNGTLEVNLINGKKVLDSAHTNYSYGALQQVLEYGLDRLKPDSDESILVLGLGGGSVLRSLQNKFNHSGPVTAVEFDQCIIDLAREEFGIEEGNGLKLICADAFEFVKSSSETYDLIIVDLFIDSEVPEPFYSHKFWEAIVNLLNQDGNVLFNAGLNLKTSQALDTLKLHFKNQLDFSQIDQVLGANTLLLGEKV